MLPSSTWLRVAKAVTVVLGVRGGVLYVRYALGWSGVQRHHVESAAVAFLVVGTFLLVTQTGRASDERPETSHSRSECALWCIGALILYWPSLFLGWLSDDFVLVERARRAEFGLVHREFFRPLPLLVWSALLPLTGPLGVHALNIAAHGVVAFLTSRVAMPLSRSRPWALLAGALILVFPAAVEAVAWSSGVFDVAAALLTLGAVLVARRYRSSVDGWTRASLAACAIAALACKETGIVAPAFIALDAWTRRERTRTLWVDVGGLAVAFVGIGALRLMLASELVRQPLSKYVVQRWAFGTVSGLVVPWHQTLTGQWPWIPVMAVVLTIAVTTVFFVSRGASMTARAAAAASGWVLLGSLPTLPFFFVAPDLQGARYLYLPAVGYAILVSRMASARGRAAKPLSAMALTVFIASGAVGSRAHQRFWQDAARTRDAVLEAARRDNLLRTCRIVAIENLPDAVNGAYVFRNGAEIAFKDLGLTLTRSAPSRCAFDWDQERRVFVPRSFYSGLRPEPRLSRSRGPPAPLRSFAGALCAPPSCAMSTEFSERNA